MKHVFIFLIILLNVSFSNAQEGYYVVDAQGEKTTLQEIIELAETKPILFFGEIHDQKFAHDAEFDLFKGLVEEYNGRVTLGMEMFEADVQPIIDEYFTGQINQKSFETESRIWNNYKTDYKAIVEYAKEGKTRLIATNVPRRYANAVYHQGIDILEKLTPYAKQFIPPLPLEIDTSLSIYQEMLEMVPDHANMNMIYSQGLKDATMAYFIGNNYNAGGVFLHLNGAYHSKNKQGIVSFLKSVPVDKTISIQSIAKETDISAYDYSTADYHIIQN